MNDQYHLLGLGPAAAVIVAVEIAELGHQVMVRGLYDPHLRRPFEMVFSQCRELRLDCLGDDSRGGLETPLIGIFVGTRAYRAPAIITTGAFELSVLYGDFRLA